MGSREIRAPAERWLEMWAAIKEAQRSSPESEQEVFQFALKFLEVGDTPAKTEKPQNLKVQGWYFCQTCIFFVRCCTEPCKMCL